MENIVIRILLMLKVIPENSRSGPFCSSQNWLKPKLAQAIFVGTFLCLRRECSLCFFVVSFPSSVRRGANMPRKGWTLLETPNGWFQLIRGPRPPSVRWEKSAQPEGRGYGKGGRWRQPKDLSKSTETRTKPIPHRSRVDPAVAMENAQSKVARLQKALEAVGDMGGVVVESMQAELAKAQAAAVLLPIDVQISKCKDFIERSERRLVWLEAETVIEKEALSEPVWPDWKRSRGPANHMLHFHRQKSEWSN